MSKRLNFGLLQPSEAVCLSLSVVEVLSNRAVANHVNVLRCTYTWQLLLDAISCAAWRSGVCVSLLQFLSDQEGERILRKKNPDLATGTCLSKGKQAIRVHKALEFEQLDISVIAGNILNCLEHHPLLCA